MPNPVQFDVSVGALPEGLDTDPQGLLEAFAARFIITPSVPWSSFTLGAAQPTSDLGPWFKGGQELWVWDDNLATYIPQVINQISLGYKVAAADPGAADYQVWFDTTAGAVKWSNGTTWTDIYTSLRNAVTANTNNFANYSTTAAMNSAISAAVSSIPASVVGQAAFRVQKSAVQDIAFGAGGNQSGVVTLDTKIFDPDVVFASNKFTVVNTGYYQLSAAAYISVPAGTPTDVDPRFYITIDASMTLSLNDTPGPDGTNGAGYTGATVAYLTAGQEVELRYDIAVDAACTIRITDGPLTQLCGYRIR